MAADLVLAGYAAVVLVGALTVLVRSTPSLVRARSVFLFTLVYFAVAAAGLQLGHASIPRHVGVAAVVAVVLTAGLAPWWFVLGGPHAAVVETMEVCFGRVCAQFERDHSGFRMSVPGGSLDVSVHALHVQRVTAISFRARPRHRKGDLFRGLLAKQYPGALPTIRIRMP
jgi:hypothetical protein